MTDTSKGRWERLTSTLLTVAAFAVAASVVYRTFFPPANRGGTGSDLVPASTRVANWEEALGIGIQYYGESDAPVKFVVVSDLECPACSAFHRRLGSVLTRYPSDVSVVFVHWPLEYHRNALPAARAAECADRVGRFKAWVDAVYAGQDSLGIRPWSSYAQEAGIVDTAMIAACAVDTASIDRIERGRAFAARIGATGTPTVLLNGSRLARFDNVDMLDSLVRRVKAGKPLE